MFNKNYISVGDFMVKWFRYRMIKLYGYIIFKGCFRESFVLRDDGY